MTTRRHFLQTTAAVAATSLIAANAHAQGGDELKVGLIGCGGRGTGAASQALKADRNVKLWAMADAFDDKIQTSLNLLQAERDDRRQDRRAGRRAASSGSRRYRQVIAVVRCGAAVHAAALSAHPSACRRRRRTSMSSPRSRAPWMRRACARCWRPVPGRPPPQPVDRLRAVPAARQRLQGHGAAHPRRRPRRHRRPASQRPARPHLAARTHSATCPT